MLAASSAERAIDETERRRARQIAHNEARGIVPRGIFKQVRDLIDGVATERSGKDDLKAAQQAADEALAFIEQSGNRALEAELHRLRGEVAAARGDRTEAKACFQRAIEVAQAQGAITWAQRAALSLGQLRP